MNEGLCWAYFPFFSPLPHVSSSPFSSHLSRCVSEENSASWRRAFNVPAPVGTAGWVFLAELACMMYRTVLVYLTVCGVASVLGGKPRARKEPRAGGTRDPAAIAADAPAPGGTPPAGEWKLRGRCSVGRAQCSVTSVCLCAREQRPVPGEGDLSVWGSRVVSWTLLRVPVWERSSQLSLHSLHWWW